MKSLSFDRLFHSASVARVGMLSFSLLFSAGSAGFAGDLCEVDANGNPNVDIVGNLVTNSDPDPSAPLLPWPRLAEASTYANGLQDAGRAAGIATGYEIEYMGLAIASVVKSNLQNKTGVEYGIGDKIASSQTKIGPTASIPLIQVLVDLGFTPELVSGPIPVNSTDKFGLQKDFFKASAVFESTIDDVNGLCIAGDAPTKQAIGVTNLSMQFDNGPVSVPAVPFKLVVHLFNQAVVDAGLSDFVLDLVEAKKGIVTGEPYFLCFPKSAEQRRTWADRNLQVNFGVTLEGFGGGSNQAFDKLFRTGKSPNLAYERYNAARKAAFNYILSDAILKGYKDDEALRAIFTYMLWRAATNTTGKNGFKLKNEYDLMPKTGIEDMVRAMGSSSAQKALATWFDGVRKDPNEAINKLQTRLISNFRSLDGAGDSMAAELRQVLCGQASETQEAWDQRPPFAFYPGEYPGETDRQYGRGVRPTIHDATIGTVFKGMYPTFQCSKSNYCFVIEGRFGDLDRSAKDPNYPLASLRPFEKATDGLSNEAVTALKKILAASSKK